MKYIKAYEWKSVIKPKVGDYVICDPLYIGSNKSFIKFIKTSIGKIKKVKYHMDEVEYIIKYKNIPPRYVNSWFEEWFSYDDTIIEVKENEIKYFANSKEELNAKILGTKYNL